MVYRHLFRCNQALESEIQSIMEGMTLAMQWTDLPMVVQSDYSVAFSALTDGSMDCSLYGHLIYPIRRLMEGREFVPLKLARDQNRVAHCLANHGRSGGSTTCRLRQRPDCITELVLVDCNPLPEE